jgi:opacity protein-like surface antigen
VRDQEFLVRNGAGTPRLCCRSRSVLWHRGWRVRRRIGRRKQHFGQPFPASTKAGWTAGAGIEAAFNDNVTARIEYLFMSLQNASCTNAPACGVDIGGATQKDTVKFSTSTIRLGVDYKFR